MNRMKVYGITLAAAVVATMAFAQEGGEAKTLPLAEARATIGAAVKDPEALTATMKQLSPADQVAFVADVNAAIAEMPGSSEEKAAAALNANKAALKGAEPGNVANVLAEVFATAPVETLGVISESFASDLFNVDADPSTSYTAEQFTAIAEGVVKKIAERTASSDDSGVRSAFGMMMMVNASNDKVPDLANTLAESLPADVREVAKNDWVPAATGEEKSYDQMIAYSSEAAATPTTTTSEPSIPLTLQLAGPQMLDAMLSDVAAGLVSVGDSGDAATPLLDQAFGGFGENTVYKTDTASNTTIPEDSGEPSKAASEDVPWSPSGYQNQN